MKRIFVPSVAALAVLAGSVLAADIKSGLPVGGSAGFFEVKDCTGPNKGKTLCYRWAYGGRPVVAIFTRRLADDLTSLVKQIDDTVAKNGDKKMAAMVVYLSDDPEAGEKKLKELAEKEKIVNTPLTVFQTSEGPDNYKISQDAEITVLMWKGLKVKANHAFGKEKLSADDIKQVVADTVKILE